MMYQFYSTRPTLADIPSPPWRRASSRQAPVGKKRHSVEVLLRCHPMRCARADERPRYCTRKEDVGGPTCTNDVGGQTCTILVCSPSSRNKAHYSREAA